MLAVTLLAFYQKNSDLLLKFQLPVVGFVFRHFENKILFVLDSAALMWFAQQLFRYAVGLFG
jgi:hypothetical protein